MRVIGYLESSFWTMRQQEFAAMMRVAYAHAGELDGFLSHDEITVPETMLAKTGERLNGTRYVEMRGNVAVVDVNGVIAKRMDMFDEICFGGCSTEKLMKDVQTCLDNPNVEAILFNIDSPGGEAFGINELSEAIYQARSKKPVKAYVSGLGCSGAYWIASAAEEVIADRSSFLGSIGVVTAWMDDKGFYEQLGIRKEVITSSNAPLKRLNIDIPEHRNELQRELDSLEAVFHSAVARNRKVSVDQVISDFNRGGVLAGADAVDAGMADRVGSLEEVIKDLQAKKTNTATVNAAAEGEIDMGFKDEFKALGVKFGLLDETKPTVEAGAELELEDEPVAGTDDQEAPVEDAPAEEQNEDEAEAPDASAATDLKVNSAKSPSAEMVEELQTNLIDAQADAFIETEIKAGRMFPAEKETFKSLFIQAGRDDLASPLTEGSRIETIKATQAARKPHGLTEEVVDAEANNKVLLASGDEPDREKKDRLLAMTPLGKSTLQLVNGGKSATAAAK